VDSRVCILIIIVITTTIIIINSSKYLSDVWVSQHKFSENKWKIILKGNGDREPTVTGSCCTVG